MKRLAICLVYSHEAPRLLERCIKHLKAQISELPLSANDIEWKIIFTPQASQKNFHFMTEAVIFSDTESIGSNRSFALKNTNAEFVYFTDPDCWGPKNTLKILYENLVLHTDDPYVFATAGPNLLRSENKIFEKFLIWLGELRWFNGGLSQIATQGATHRWDWHSPTCNILYHKSRLEDEAYAAQNIRVGEDLEFHYRISKKNKKILICKEAFVWHEQSESFSAYFKKIFYYGFAQTQLLKHWPASALINKRLVILVAAIIWLTLSFFWTNPTAYFLTSLTLVLALISLEYFLYKKPKHYFVFLSSYLCVLSAYTVGQLYGLLSPRPQK